MPDSDRHHYWDLMEAIRSVLAVRQRMLTRLEVATLDELMGESAVADLEQLVNLAKQALDQPRDSVPDEDLEVLIKGLKRSHTALLRRQLEALRAQRAERREASRPRGDP